MNNQKGNKIYKALLDGLQGNYAGNAHHAAQRLTIRVIIALLPEQQRKIYDAMWEGLLMSTSLISKECVLPVKQVSAQLKQLQKNTPLITSEIRGRKRYYKRLKQSL